jgi:deoxyribonuclease V
METKLTIAESEESTFPETFQKVEEYGSLTETQARDLQRSLASLVSKQWSGKKVRYVAGADTAFDEKSQRMFAALVVVDVQTKQQVACSELEGWVHFPYIPGLFSFREVPLLVQAYEKLEIKPDLILCDGHGLIHPRRFGLACHLGVLLDVPTIGCGKTHLIGTCGTPAEPKGSVAPVTEQDEIIGHLLRTRDGVRSIYVSVGHQIDQANADRWVLAMISEARIPDPIRWADQRVNAMRKEFWKQQFRQPLTAVVVPIWALFRRNCSKPGSLVSLYLTSESEHVV